MSTEALREPSTRTLCRLVILAATAEILRRGSSQNCRLAKRLMRGAHCPINCFFRSFPQVGTALTLSQIADPVRNSA